MPWTMVVRQHDVIRKAYQNFEFHKVYHTLHNLCVVDLSAFYLDIIKDRLYVEKQDGLKRRSAQTVLWQILLMLLEDMAPVLSFTAEEAFQALPEAIKGALPQDKTVFALRFAPERPALSDAERARWRSWPWSGPRSTRPSSPSARIGSSASPWTPR